MLERLTIHFDRLSEVTNLFFFLIVHNIIFWIIAYNIT